MSLVPFFGEDRHFSLHSDFVGKFGDNILHDVLFSRALVEDLNLIVDTDSRLFPKFLDVSCGFSEAADFHALFVLNPVEHYRRQQTATAGPFFMVMEFWFESFGNFKPTLLELVTHH